MYNNRQFQGLVPGTTLKTFQGQYITTAITGYGQVVAQMVSFNDATKMATLTVFTPRGIVPLQVHESDMYGVALYNGPIPPNFGPMGGQQGGQMGGQMGGQQGGQMGGQMGGQQGGQMGGQMGGQQGGQMGGQMGGQQGGQMGGQQGWQGGQQGLQGGFWQGWPFGG